MYAEIAVNAPVKSTFHYHIPPELDGKIRPGHLVQVRFGTAIQHGIVLSLLEHSPIEETKPIEERLDPLPVVTLQQIELARWMSETYLAPIGLCLWLMLPPGLTGKDFRVTLLDENAVGADFFQLQMIRLLQRRGPLTGQQLSSALGRQGEKKANWTASLDALKTAGIVTVETILAPPKSKPKTARTAALAIHPDHIPDVARHLGKTSRSADLLEVIAAMSEEEWGLVDEALRIAGSTRPTLNKLVDAGYVQMDPGERGEPSLVALAIPPESLDEVLIDLRQGHTQLDALELLARESIPVNVKTVTAQTGATANDLKRLADDGLILLGEEPDWRDSLAAREFIPVIAPRLTPDQQVAWQQIEAVISQWSFVPHPQPDPSLTLPESREGTRSSLKAPSPNSGEAGQGAENYRKWQTPSHLWRALKPLVQQKRTEPTPAENHLWEHLRRDQLGVKFRRQHPIDRFIVDFYCAEVHLIIEVDGEIHQYTPEEDAVRQQFLELLGHKVIRFTNAQVFESTDEVIAAIKATLDEQRLISLPEFGEGPGEGLKGEVFLLHGVTGSGKTEIYLRAIELTLAQGRQAIFLVPEIAITPQTVRRVAERFPGQVAIVHGSLSPGERSDTWRRAREGQIQIVVGARSALFTPFPDVGLVILDEEHDHSYKQSPPMQQPYYHARYVAQMMMRANDGVLILGSATPDLETVYRAQRGEIRGLHLPNRIMGHRDHILKQADQTGITARYYPADSEDALTIDLPRVQIIDMRDELKSGNVSMFSGDLQEALSQVLERKEQAILFLNRRGQSTFVFCRDCGHIETCPRCDTPLTFHRMGQALRCHHCGHQQAPPAICPSCKSRRIKFFGAGTQQVETEIVKQFPQARLVRWDADTAANHTQHEAILQQFIDQQADIMIGTQMIAKGLDLPLVTLVGVVSADLALALPDFRAGERTFQLLTQVAGRAGRGLLGGQVILQTYQPGNYAIQAAAQHDYAGFYETEIAYRKQLGYPPFRRLARMIFRYPNEARARSEAERAAAILRARIDELQMTGTELIGPAPCFFAKLENHYRWHLLLRGPDPTPALQDLDLARGWHLDLDPLDML